MKISMQNIKLTYIYFFNPTKFINCVHSTSMNDGQ